MSDGEIAPFRFAPVTPATRADLERFSAAYGKFRYCSCLRWRLRSNGFRDAADRPALLAGLVAEGRPVGVLAYRDEDPVGWCSVAPRDSYAAITASTTIASPPGTGVWSVTCFFLAPSVRRQGGAEPVTGPGRGQPGRGQPGRGLQASLLAAACDYAVTQGARIIEAYPWPGGASYRYMGTRELYADAGFTDVPGPGGARPVMRYYPPGGGGG